MITAVQAVTNTAKILAAETTAAINKVARVAAQGITATGINQVPVEMQAEREAGITDLITGILKKGIKYLPIQEWDELIMKTLNSSGFFI